MKILLDMNLSPDWREILRACGHEAAHWSEIGKPEASDEQLMQWCMDNDFVLPTQDLDFGALLFAAGAIGPSVIQIRSADASPRALGEVINRVLMDAAQDIKRGVLLTVYADRHRLAMLPLGKRESSHE